LKIHIISFDIPSPPTYGGVIDVYYKIKSLYQIGYHITLHCYEYNDRKVSDELKSFCKEIHIYKRNNFLPNPIDFYKPMIVFTRNHNQLLKRLLLDESPILFEGLHTTYFLNNKKLKNRIKIVRMHNIEHDYYKELAKNEVNFFKKTYYFVEALLLKRYERVLENANAILAISLNDTQKLLKSYKNVFHINAFHGFETEKNTISKYYALYHGKLNVNENEIAAKFLINNVFSKIDFPFLIAGNNPSMVLRKLAKKYKHTRIIKNPSIKQMSDLVHEAHLNILPTFQATGIKLKLLHVLYHGKFVIVNKQMIENTGLESLVIIANTPEQILEKIEIYKNKTFEISEIEKRKNILAKYFNNEENAHKIHAIITDLK
jgi:hypothetical protein